ncbi:O-antigen ligase family protein [Altererythrobacter lauratis]|uniref:O-antigen ligase family protein n=1 Tax=Alteraurantiacibacter lauratis TaxID=2054627 RepID=UPI003015FB2E
MQLQALIVLAFLLGGGGVAYGLNNLAIQLFALLLLAVNGRAVGRFVVHAPLFLRLLVLLTLALPLVQLVPLPPAIWQALPGREAVLASHMLTGLGDGQWASLSLDRGRTLTAFAGLIPPATLIALGTMLPDADKRALAWTAVACGGAALVLGAVQLQGANTYGLLYPIDPGPNILYATFANRNSTGLFFVIGACLALALADPARLRVLLAGGSLAVLLLIGAILTQSRSSMVLIALPLALLLLRLMAFALRRGPRADRKVAALGLVLALGGALALGAIAYSAAQGGRVADAIARFEDRRTDRPEMWEDTLYAAGQYWPAGSGAATFDEVFQLHESLEYVSPRKAGRAHSDWLEVALESGIAGLVLAAGWLVFALFSSWQHLRRGPWWPGVGAGVAGIAIAAQALIDYPLRNQALLCMAGLLVVLLATRLQEKAK